MSQTYTYTFTDSAGYTDTINVTVSTTLQKVSNPTGYRQDNVSGEGYAVTSISGTFEGQKIVGMAGSGGTVQYGYSSIYDNTIFPNASSGVNSKHSASPGNTDGIDLHGLEFTTAYNQYNLFTSKGTFELLNDYSGNTSTLTLDSTNAPCFCAGTLISTPNGDRPVETLEAGDLVLTVDGDAVPVRWIGRRAVEPRFADPLRSQPIRIRQGALGNGLPARDLLVSPDHAMFLDGLLVQAGAMVNGVSILRETRMTQRFTYYHIETPDHSLILAEAAPTETFVDNVDRMAFDNWAEYEALDSERAPVMEMPYGRVKSARQLPVRLRAKLNSSAVAYQADLQIAA
ncbi:Hint domain-containing protein [Acidocella aminolytica]|jgi:hypothetical protein|uniref:Hedgehog/Intein (Hint) domain-containing protein n=1 Tax=Acidocella aminolytica 101 = DSM 11237 TaxID=1120923 RepID=A0A0D6PIE2_9PROT|nr:Hint domain-containing protein [Acidocella aminolytica]GAN80978.1 hypothetical protein Aam_066_042 [Acidocella aminolytica 101 = DSM 11237]GBQ37117.1 hypothetical protein AA11237_1432 [Acidocella aminolytica 101 = DSM 11237]SHF30966.1 Hint domain-containing protein [Acidocella aminolytica 101 = DSM 11237]